MDYREAAKFLFEFSRNVNDVNLLVKRFAPNDLQDALELAIEALDMMEENNNEIEQSYEHGYKDGYEDGAENSYDSGYEKGFADAEAGRDASVIRIPFGKA